jgi:hypothetical protein
VLLSVLAAVNEDKIYKLLPTSFAENVPQYRGSPVFRMGELSYLKFGDEYYPAIVAGLYGDTTHTILFLLPRTADCGQDYERYSYGGTSYVFSSFQNTLKNRLFNFWNYIVL